MIQDVLSQNEDLRKRVRELEEAVKRGRRHGACHRCGRRGTKDPAAPVAGEVPKDPATPVAGEVPAGPVKTAREKIQLGGALQVEAKYNKAYNGVKSSDLALTTAEFDFEADVVDWAKGSSRFSGTVPTTRSA